jgi:hypothetical protein
MENSEEVTCAQPRSQETKEETRYYSKGMDSYPYYGLQYGSILIVCKDNVGFSCDVYDLHTDMYNIVSIAEQENLQYSTEAGASNVGFQYVLILPQKMESVRAYIRIINKVGLEDDLAYLKEIHELSKVFNNTQRAQTNIENLIDKLSAEHKLTRLKIVNIDVFGDAIIRNIAQIYHNAWSADQKLDITRLQIPKSLRDQLALLISVHAQYIPRYILNARYGAFKRAWSQLEK